MKLSDQLWLSFHNLMLHKIRSVLTSLGIIFGEQEAPFQSERVQAIVELFEGSGVHYRVTEHIREEMWAKFRLNVCNNLPQAILGAGVGAAVGSLLIFCTNLVIT